MYIFIIKLVDIFKLKKKIFDDLKNLVGSIKEIIDVPYTDESQQLVLKHRIFHEDIGLLPSLDALFKANDELVHYQDDEDSVSIKDKFGINMGKNLSQCGLTIHRNYLDMMAVVEREQYFIDKFFKPILKEIIQKKRYKEEWAIRLSHFGNFIRVLEVDLEYFYILLHNLKDRGFLGESIEVRNKNRAIIKNNVVVSIQANDFIHVRYWITYAKNRDWFDKEELMMLNNLILSIESKDIDKLELLIKTKLFQKIFHKEEIEFFNGIAGKLREEREGGINSTQLASNLMAESELLEQLNELAKEIGASQNVIEQIAEETERVDEAIESIEEAAPEVEKSSQVKKFKKSKFRRLRARFRLARRKYKKINKREILNRGLKVLNHSIALINRLNTYLESLRIKSIIHKKEQIENEITKWVYIQKKAIYFLRIGNNFRSSTKAALNKAIEEANSMIDKLKKVKDISVSKKVIKLSYLRRFAIYSLMSTYMALGLGGTVGTFSTKEVLDVKPIQGEEETIRIPLINTEVNLNPIISKETSDAEPKKVIEEPMQKPLDAISSITNKLQQEENLHTEPEIPSVTVRSSISETAPNLQRQDRQFSTTKPPTIKPIIKESQIKETEFRLKILEGARVQVGLPVDFDTLFLNVCIDIVVRSMQSAGIKIEGNVNKRLVASVAPWMMRNKAKPKALNEVKPGMMIFFSGMDSDTNKFKEWKHSGVVYEVNADGTIKSVVMSTSYPWDGSKPQVKIVNFDDWLKRTFKNYGMKVRAILDPYDLVRNG